MNVLEMMDSELYKIGVKILTDKLGVSEVPRFIRQCKPGKGDYSTERHELLANQTDIDTIFKRIQDRRAVREAEEHARAERFTMPQKEIQKMTDIEILEIGNQVLINKLGVAGLIGFIRICQELNGGYAQDRITSTDEAKEFIKLYTTSLTLNPRIVEDYIKRGNAYSYIGEYDKAIADYSEVIKLRPDCAEAYSHRAKTFLKKADYDRSITDYTKAIELNPQDIDAYYARGKIYELQKNNVG